MNIRRPLVVTAMVGALVAPTVMTATTAQAAPSAATRACVLHAPRGSTVTAVRVLPGRSRVKQVICTYLKSGVKTNKTILVRI